MSNMSFAGQTIQLASHLYDVRVDEILSPKRDSHIVRARQAAMAVLRDLKGYSYPTIGRRFDRDHTTVMHAKETVDNLLQTDADFAARYILLRNECEELNEKFMRALRAERASTRVWGPRMTTTEVCELAGYGPVTLMRRVRAGRMPEPVDRAREHIFDRDQVMKALGLVELQPEAEPTW